MSKKKNFIPGVLLWPIGSSVENYIEIIHSADYAVKEGFLKAYSDHKAVMQIIGECAKIYIYQNWEKVTDWGALEVVLDGAHYHNHEKKDKLRFAENEHAQRLSRMLDDFSEKVHNPVTSLQVHSLAMDGDLSLIVNGVVYRITDEEAVIIADYIEKQLEAD